MKMGYGKEPEHHWRVKGGKSSVEGVLDEVGLISRF